MSKFKVGDKIKLIVSVGPSRDDGVKGGVGKGDTLTCVDKAEPLEGYCLGNGEVSCEWANKYKFYFEKKKQMKKSDLRTGMRVVHGKHPRCTEAAIVVSDLGKIMFKDGSYNYLHSYCDDLKCSDVWDITEIYAAPERDILNFDVKGDLLWKREEKTPEQIQLDKVMDRIAELQHQASQLQELINK